MVKFLLFFVAFSFSSIITFASQPENLILGKHAQTVLLADKSGCRLSVFQYNQDQTQFEKIKSYVCESGKRSGDKKIEGDERTPTGVYFLQRAWTGRTLKSKYGKYADVYGSGAFEMSYPNYLDRYVLNNGGSGIWLHGTIEVRPKATRGCISLGNDHLLDVGQYISLRQTQIVVSDSVKEISDEQMQSLRQGLLAFLESWRSTWESGTTQDYLKHYSADFKNAGFDFQQWQGYKTKINARNQNRKIGVSETVIFKAKNIFHIQFKQDYQSSHTNQVGYKTLYVKEEDGRYLILSEEWAPLNQHQSAQHDVLPSPNSST